jgi:hypothetical protein
MDWLIRVFGFTERVRVIATLGDRQHTEQAGAMARRPVPPLVRDEEAARLIRPPGPTGCWWYLPVVARG